MKARDIIKLETRDKRDSPERDLPGCVAAGDTIEDTERLMYYFDRSGKIVIRIPMGPNLNNANLFVSGRLRVKQGFTRGYKDATGAWAIPPKYNDAQNFEGGLARVEVRSEYSAAEAALDPQLPGVAHA